MQCDQLLIIAGPTGAGKPTLIDRLYEGNLPSISETLSLGSGQYIITRKTIPECHCVSEPDKNSYSLGYV